MSSLGSFLCEEMVQFKWQDVFFLCCQNIQLYCTCKSEHIFFCSDCCVTLLFHWVCQFRQLSLWQIWLLPYLFKQLFLNKWNFVWKIKLGRKLYLKVPNICRFKMICHCLHYQPQQFWSILKTLYSTRFRRKYLVISYIFALTRVTKITMTWMLLFFAFNIVCKFNATKSLCYFNVHCVFKGPTNVLPRSLWFILLKAVV